MRKAVLKQEYSSTAEYQPEAEQHQRFPKNQKESLMGAVIQQTVYNAARNQNFQPTQTIDDGRKNTQMKNTDLLQK